MEVQVVNPFWYNVTYGMYITNGVTNGITRGWRIPSATATRPRWLALALGIIRRSYCRGGERGLTVCAVCADLDDANPQIYPTRGRKNWGSLLRNVPRNWKRSMCDKCFYAWYHVFFFFFFEQNVRRTVTNWCRNQPDLKIIMNNNCKCQEMYFVCIYVFLCMVVFFFSLLLSFPGKNTRSESTSKK